MSASALSRAVALQAKVGAVADHLRSPLLLLIRLYWGWGFFEAGKGKLANLEKTTEAFTSLSIPAPGLNAAVAGSVECFGGLLLLVGLFSRIVTIPLAFTMLVAYLTAHSAEFRGVFSEPDAFLGAPPFLFLYASLIVLAFGPGAFSVDAYLARRGTATSRNN